MAHSSQFAVPVVDISPYTGPSTSEARNETARRLDEACATVGFVQILGHGIPGDVLTGLTDAVDAFFSQPLDTKMRYRVPGANRGYSPPRSESLSLSLGIESASGMNDFFEAFNTGAEARSFPHLDLSEDDYGLNVWPDVDGFRAGTEAYFAEAARVARALTTAFADALSLPAGFFDQLTDHSVDVLRMNNYALPEGSVTLEGDIVGMSEHTDFGIVTVLWADQAPGLQILDANGTWHDVSPIDDALLVNLGDLTARLTNDRWRSTLHRVRPPIVDNTIQSRRSVAFFHDGNIDALITTPPNQLDPGEDPTYEPILVRDHIKAKLAGSRQGRANPNATREAARVKNARTSTSTRQ